MHTAQPDFVSLNGPDNVGKTTQLRLLAQRRPGFHPLGAIHEHDRELWARVAADDYARWWFETSTTVELTEMLLASHTKRATAREESRTGLLDRGWPMLLAVAAATCAVKDGLTAATRGSGRPVVRAVPRPPMPGHHPVVLPVLARP